MKLIELKLLNGRTILVNIEKISYMKHLPSYNGSTIVFNDDTKINVHESLKDILTLIKEESK